MIPQDSISSAPDHKVVGVDILSQLSVDQRPGATHDPTRLESLFPQQRLAHKVRVELLALEEGGGVTEKCPDFHALLLQGANYLLRLVSGVIDRFDVWPLVEVAAQVELHVVGVLYFAQPDAFPGIEDGVQELVNYLFLVVRDMS